MALKLGKGVPKVLEDLPGEQEVVALEERDPRRSPRPLWMEEQAEREYHWSRRVDLLGRSH